MVKVFGQGLWSGSWLVVQLAEWLVLWLGYGRDIVGCMGSHMVGRMVLVSVRLGGLVVVKMWLGTG